MDFTHYYVIAYLNYILRSTHYGISFIINNITIHGVLESSTHTIYVDSLKISNKVILGKNKICG